jgi:hypothetical protein
MTSPDLAEGLRAICAEVDFDLDLVDEEVLDRMRVLGEHTETVADVKRMAAYAADFFRYVERARPPEAFDEVERQIVVLGSLFSDIGKTGPKRADRRAQRLVVEMFSVEGVRDESQPVSRFLRAYFPGDAEERVARFSSLGLDPEMPMRQFWNLHSAWTLEIVDAAGVPPEAVAAAAAHHLLDDVNPEAIVGRDGKFTREFGENVAFDRAEKLVIVLDKYDALRRRGGFSHGEAIDWLRRRLAQSAQFRDDREFQTLIDDLDAVHARAPVGATDSTT